MCCPFQGSESVFEGQLVTRLCCFQLLEVLYSRLSKDELVGMSSAMNRVFTGGNPQTGKELTSFVSKYGLHLKLYFAVMSKVVN